MVSPFAPAPLAISRLGIVEAISAQQQPPDAQDSNPSLTGLAAVALPALLAGSNSWLLQHASPSTGELITWNWDYQSWFKEGGGLSTYKLLDKQLLRTVAAVFTRLQLTQVASTQGSYEEYVVAATETDAPPVVPRLLYYTNLARNEQYLALYNQRTAYSAGNSTLASGLSVYEIVQVALDANTLHRRLQAAQQAAIRENHWLLG